MGYYLQAIICNDSLVGVITSDFINAKKVKLNERINLIPFTSDLFDEFNECQESVSLDKFEFLNEKLFAYLMQKSILGPIAYVEAEYFGGIGEQAAIIFVDGSVHIDTRKLDNSYGAINTVLREFGVQRKSEKDEWDTIGMLRHRNTEDWLEDAE